MIAHGSILVGLPLSVRVCCDAALPCPARHTDTAAPASPPPPYTHTLCRLSPEEAAEAEAAEAQLMERLTSMTQTQAQRADLVAGYNDFKKQFK